MIHTCVFPSTHPKTKTSTDVSIDLPSNGLVKKFTYACFLVETLTRPSMSKRKSLASSCRYLNPESALQYFACSPKWSKHALRQKGHVSSTRNKWIIRRYLSLAQHYTDDICWPRPSIK